MACMAQLLAVGLITTMGAHVERRNGVLGIYAVASPKRRKEEALARWEIGVCRQAHGDDRALAMLLTSLNKHLENLAGLAQLTSIVLLRARSVVAAYWRALTHCITDLAYAPFCSYFSSSIIFAAWRRLFA